jgi:putative hydrolase of the HAD superfamily
MENIKNIIFDLGGVLVGLDGQRSIDAFDRLGCQRVSQYIVEHRTEDLFYRIELGLISTHEFCEEVREMTQTTATDEQMVAAWNALLTPLSERRVARLLQWHRKGYRIFLLSNTNDMHWQHCARVLFPEEVLKAFRQVFLSYEMQLAKPDRRIFEEVLRQADIRADETLFIDDNQDNVATAATLGIVAFHNKNIDQWTEALQL